MENRNTPRATFRASLWWLQRLAKKGSIIPLRGKKVTHAFYVVLRRRRPVLGTGIRRFAAIPTLSGAVLYLPTLSELRPHANRPQLGTTESLTERTRNDVNASPAVTQCANLGRPYPAWTRPGDVTAYSRLSGGLAGPPLPCPMIALRQNGPEGNMLSSLHASGDQLGRVTIRERFMPSLRGFTVQTLVHHQEKGLRTSSTY